MANITKPSVTGIDIPIQNLQTYIYNGLQPIWGEYTQYGRAYRNQTKDGYTPEVYVGGNEYKEVYFDDTISALSFFGLGDNQSINNGNLSADVYLIFMVDLSKIKDGNTRNDEEARVDVEILTKSLVYGFVQSGYITGIDSVFKEYSGWRKDSGIKFRDTQPFHCFRINFKLNYNIYTLC